MERYKKEMQEAYSVVYDEIHEIRRVLNKFSEKVLDYEYQTNMTDMPKIMSELAQVILEGVFEDYKWDNTNYTSRELLDMFKKAVNKLRI